MYRKALDMTKKAPELHAELQRQLAASGEVRLTTFACCECPCLKCRAPVPRVAADVHKRHRHSIVITDCFWLSVPSQPLLLVLVRRR